jgi:hypothetical protein
MSPGPILLRKRTKSVDSSQFPLSKAASSNRVANYINIMPLVHQ